LKTKLTVFLTSLLVWAGAYAQNIGVRVTVRNEKNEAVQNATAQILRYPDSSLMIVKTVKNNAYFSLTVGKTYFLRITSVSINEVFRTITIEPKDTILNITAQAKSKNLDAVTVTSKKPLLKQEDDKTIVDAEVLASSSTNALEVLEKTPGAIVDNDGNVYLNSATPALIYINGREVKLSAADVASLLKSLPANSISKIEILRSPSAKYDASGSGGIVNVVLKKGVKIGLNGSVEATHFQGKYPTNSAGFNINNRTDKVNSYLSANITRRTNYEMLESDRPLSSIIFNQRSYTRYPNLNTYVGGGLDYTVNKKLTLSYDARATVNRNKSRARNDINIDTIPSLIETGTNISLINNNGPSFYLSNSISSEYKIDSAGSEWTMSLDYNYYNYKNTQDYSNIFVLPAGATVTGDGKTKNQKNIITYKSDLVLKLRHAYTLEAGAKFNFSNSTNNADYFVNHGAVRYIDNFQTNTFRYKENIFAAYLQASKTFSGFTIKPGLRLETTDITGHQLVPRDTTFSIKRTDLFPYIYLRHSIAKLFGFKLTGNAIYRRSITRPYYEVLNPYPKFIDQYTYDIGNPGLKPQFTTNYELNITADDFPIFSLGLNDINDIFSGLTYQKDRILYRTYDNLGKNKEVYLRLVGGIPPGKKYFFYAGTQMNAVNYNGYYGNAPFKYKNTSWTFFMYHNYKPTPDLNIGVNGWMRTKSIQNFFELKNFGGLNITANQSILNKKMNVIISANDILRSQKNEFNINVPGFIGHGLRSGDTRRIGLTLRYNFGFRPREEKKPSFDAPAESN
jgi:iron complex outermembrane receptor protein